MSVDSTTTRHSSFSRQPHGCQRPPSLIETAIGSSEHLPLYCINYRCRGIVNKNNCWIALEAWENVKEASLDRTFFRSLRGWMVHDIVLAACLIVWSIPCSYCRRCRRPAYPASYSVTSRPLMSPSSSPNFFLKLVCQGNHGSPSMTGHGLIKYPKIDGKSVHGICCY